MRSKCSRSSNETMLRGLMIFSEWIKKRDDMSLEGMASYSDAFKSFLEKRDIDLYDDINNESIGKYAAPLLMGIGGLLGGGDAKAAPDMPVKAASLPKITHEFENGILTINIPAKNSSHNAVTDVSDIIRMINAKLPKKYGYPNRVYDVKDLNRPIFAKELAEKINSNQNKDFTLRLKFSQTPTFDQKNPEKKEDEKVAQKGEDHKWSDDDLKILVRGLNKKFADKGLRLNEADPKSNFKFYKPKDFIQSGYGDKYKDVLSSAEAAQKKDKTKEMLDVSRIENNIPVLLVDPLSFGINADGFCDYVTIGGKKLEYCVVKGSLSEDERIVALKHELRHTMQDVGPEENILFGDKLKDKKEKYLFDKNEIAVRLGKLKNKYSELTGKDPSNFDKAWEHFEKNPDSYDYDVRQLNMNVNVVDRHKLRTGENLHKEFKDYLRSSWEKVVKKDGEQKDKSLAR